MFYKGLIFDLDNTLYSYDDCHSSALNKCINYLVDISKNYSYIEIKCIYDEISYNLKNELNNTASSHNKSIYFKHIIEKLNISCYYSHFVNINNMYWETFYENIKSFDYVKEFLEWNKSIGIKIGILTDYETEHQIIKLQKLKLLDFIDCIVTSEEVGIDKPSSKIFLNILDKLKLHADDVIMFGDSYEKDIRGALNLKMLTYWVNKNNLEFSSMSFENVYFKFININNQLNCLKHMSKYCGERFDMVQAGGGNISVKSDDKLMFIKASGYNLTNVDETKGYVVVNNEILLKDIKNKTINDDIVSYNYIGINRGSIETYMHSILKKYTIHLHPIQINKILISKTAREIIEQIYPSGLIIDYLTPGIKICNEIYKLYDGQNVIFLLNHGIIVTFDDYNKIFEIIEDVLIKFETYQNINFDKYKFTNKISNIINNKCKLLNITYLCEDAVINNYFIQKKELFKMKITFPDALIYCGSKMLFGLNSVDEYIKIYNEHPKIIIENNLIYINSHNLNKCKEIEDVLKSNLIILDNNLENNYLTFDEICFLNNWDAEKYRKNL